MTCIVGIIEDGITYLGGDGLQLKGDRKTRVDSKVYERGEFLIGGAGRGTVIDLLFHSTNYVIPKDGQTIKDYFYNEFIPELRMVLKDKGQIHTEDGKQSMETQFLIGYRGELVNILKDFGCGIDTQDTKYSAIGSGEEFALGSLYSTEAMGLDPEERIILALEAASEHHCTVGPPFEVISMDQSMDNIHKIYESMKEDVEP